MPWGGAEGGQGVLLGEGEAGAGHCRVEEVLQEGGREVCGVGGGAAEVGEEGG